jgi:hypothetical protein
MAAANASTRGGPFCSPQASAAVGLGWQHSTTTANSAQRERYGLAIALLCQPKKDKSQRALAALCIRAK